MAKLTNDGIDLEQILQGAISLLFEKDLHLLQMNASERSLTHRLALHLTELLPSYDVDCEYNRDGKNTKKLTIPVRNTESDNLDAITVFPDIVVHKRGDRSMNLPVLEIKKKSSTESKVHDINKLEAFKRELLYTFAAHITLGLNRDGNNATEIMWQD